MRNTYSTLALATALSAALLTPTNSTALEGYYISPNISFPFSDGKREADEDYAFHVMGGLSLNDYVNLEAGFQGDKFILDDESGEYKQHSGNVDLVWFPRGKGAVSPYLLAGLGWMQTDFKGTKYNNPTSNVGAGLFWDIYKPGGLMLRGGATLRQDYDDASTPGASRFQETMVYGGITYIFDKSWYPAELTKPIVNVTQVTIEEPPSYPEFVVEFGVNSSILDENAQDQLDQVVQELKADPDLRAEITGHTDIQGKESDEYNIWLADKRAFKVHDFLIDLGIYPGRMEVKSYGPYRPAVPNATASHKNKNRRVEIRLFK